MKRLYFILALLLLLSATATGWAQVSVETTSGITTEVRGALEISLDGNWTNNGTLTAGNSTITLIGSGVQAITNASGAFNNLTINKAGGDAQAGGNFSVDGTLTLTSGDVDLNGNVITLGTSALLAETAGNTVKGANGYLETTRTLNAPSADNVGGLGFEITSAANLGSTVLRRGHAQQSGNGNQSIARYFDATPTNNSGLNATVVYRYDDSELGGQTEADLELYKSTDSGTNWSAEGGTANATNNTVTQSGIASLSRWTVADQALDGTRALLVDAGGDADICAGQSVQIGGSPTASGGTPPYLYRWFPATGLDDRTLANPTATPTATTHYIVGVRDANGTVVTDTVIVTVNPNPVADAGPGQTIAAGGSVQIGGSPTASGGLAPYTYTWSPSTGLDDATLANPTANPAATTTYTVTITDANGCTDSDQTTVTVGQPGTGKTFVLLAVGLLDIDQPKNSFGDLHSNQDLHFQDALGNTHTGNVTAVADIIIDDGNTIVGDVTAGGSIMNDGTVTGTVTPNANVAVEPLPTIAPFSAGTQDITIADGATLSLAPGDYGVVDVGKSATLKLSPGVYNLEKLRAGNQALIDIAVASGKVTINIEDNLLFGHFVRFGGVTTANLEDTDSLNINIAGSDLVIVGNNALLYGSIAIPNADLDIEDNLLLKGAICAENIEIGMNGRFLSHAFGVVKPVLAKADAEDALSAQQAQAQLAGAWFEAALAGDGEAVAEAAVPEVFALEQNYPNPFNPSTVIRFQLPATSTVKLSIYNMTGQLVRTLVAGERAAGSHTVTWDATDDSGARVSSGVYLAVLQAGAFRAQQKLTLLK